jgi:high-affinity iron transporter
MDIFLPGMIMGFREGLEAFLVIAVILQFLNKSNLNHFKKNTFTGAFTGVGLSLLLGGLIYYASSQIDRTSEMAKLWESGTSLIALVLVTTFIIWMIKYGHDMVYQVHQQVSNNLSASGIFTIAMVMVMREGAEIAIFTFAGKYTLLSISMGIALSLILTVLIYHSLVKVNLKVLFGITLSYLILQAGFLFGYGIHEGLSAMKDLSLLSSDHWIFTKAFNLSDTIFNHKDGLIGLPLYVTLGWYSKPEIIQFIVQYGYTIGIFLYWKKRISTTT